MIYTKKIKILSTVLYAAIIVLGMVSSASALLITPATTPQWTGNQTSQNEIDAIIGPIMNYAPMLYKQDVGQSDVGPFAGSYATFFYNIPTDPKDADIVWVGPSVIVGSPLYLLVKDGNEVPAWYLFGLNYEGAPSWNGTDEIQLRDFWPGNGSISHIALYGTTTTVPEPLTMLLLGLGLVGVAGVRRYRK